MVKKKVRKSQVRKKIKRKEKKIGDLAGDHKRTHGWVEKKNESQSHPNKRKTCQALTSKIRSQLPGHTQVKLVVDTPDQERRSRLAAAG